MFDAAARHLNFRLAAEEANLTQGAVAQAIRALEADLDVLLFHRNARGLTFTEVGQRYHSDVSRGLAIIEEATKKSQPESNAVTISVPPSFASKWLVPRLPKFMEINPETEVRIFASEHITDFQTQDVDAAVRQGGRPANHDLAIHRLAGLDLKAYCSPNADFCPVEPCGLRDLADLPLIQDGHRFWEKLLPEQGLPCPKASLQFNQTSLALDAAANGQGIAIAPHLIAFGDVNTGRLREVWLEEAEPELGFWLVHPVKQTANRIACKALIDWIADECR